MPSPFPGFDPYIENHTDWSSFHTAFYVELLGQLFDVLPPGFDARIEAHLSIIFPEVRPSGKGLRTGARQADVAVFATAPNTPRGGNDGGGVAVADRTQVAAQNGAATRPLREPEVVVARRGTQRSLRIVDGRSGQENVVAVFEILSPTNKDGRAGSEAYRAKQSQLLRTPIHLIEIDLLRGGEHAAYVPEGEIATCGDWDYLVTLRDRDAPEEYRFWRINVRDTLPTFLLPLTTDVEPVPLDLQETFARTYDVIRLGRRLDYGLAPDPQLSPADAAWADALLRVAGLRADTAVPSENEHEARGGPTESDGEWLEATAN